MNATHVIQRSGRVLTRCVNPGDFALVQSPRILQHLGASPPLLKINEAASKQMTAILESQMVQRMAIGTLDKEEWDRKYMRADALYIYNLGRALEARANNEKGADFLNLTTFAQMFLGYGKHFERLQKHGVSVGDTLESSECDRHIALLSQETSIDEFYIAILTDMIPYVVLANYLLCSMDEVENHPWKEYAKKYGDLNSKYAKERLGRAIHIANGLLLHQRIDTDRAQKLFTEGFVFEEWFIRQSFAGGFTVKSAELDKQYSRLKLPGKL